jgi:SAM-dependent methyltransferase
VNRSAAAPGLRQAVRVRPGGRVLDVSRRADICRLPFEDASFDVVVCRQRLQMYPDRGLALSEMRRVLVREGLAAISVAGPMERSPVFGALADSLERHAGLPVAAGVRSLFTLSDAQDLRASLAWAGFADIRVATTRESTFLPSVTDLLRFVPGGRMGRTERTVIAELQRELAPWIDTEGLRLTMEVHRAVARR